MILGGKSSVLVFHLMITIGFLADFSNGKVVFPLSGHVDYSFA